MIIDFLFWLMLGIFDEDIFGQFSVVLEESDILVFVVIKCYLGGK